MPTGIILIPNEKFSSIQIMIKSNAGSGTFYPSVITYLEQLEFSQIFYVDSTMKHC